MRTHRLAASAFALALACHAPAAGADPRSDIARELIVAFAAPASHSARARATAPHSPSGKFDPAAFAHLGLRPLGSLAERSAIAARSGIANLFMPANPFALDPGRIWLFAASDSGAATAALHALERDPRVAWVERNVPREAALWSYAPAPMAAPAPGPHPTSPPQRYAGDFDFPNDPMFRDGRQWGLDNRSSPDRGTPGADVRALEAWRVSTGTNDLLLEIGRAHV